MPGPLDDPVLGHLDWEESYDWWVGSIELAPGHRIDVFVVHDYKGDPAQEIAQARRALARVREREAEYRHWSAAVLHGKRWNTEEPMTVEDIADLLRVAGLEFSPDGRTRIFWDDEDVLFCGHNVFTDLGADGECLAAGMQ